MCHSTVAGLAESFEALAALYNGSNPKKSKLVATTRIKYGV